MNETENMNQICRCYKELPEKIEATIEAYLIENNIQNDDYAVSNIVFNVLANSLQAWMKRNNKDFLDEFAEFKIQQLSERLRKAYQLRCN